MQAQLLHFPSSSLLWINTYLPNDPGLMRGWDDSELQKCLSEIERVIRETTHSDVLLSADLNWDTERKTQFSNFMKEFVARTRLVSLHCSQTILSTTPCTYRLQEHLNTRPLPGQPSAAATTSHVSTVVSGTAEQTCRDTRQSL